jgi:hypothetical protein
MAIVLFVQRLITIKAIGLDGGSVLDIRLDKGGQDGSCRVGDKLQTNAARCFTAILYRSRDLCLSPSATAALSVLGPPMYVSSTSMMPLKGSRLGATIARRSLWSIVQTVS